MAGKLQVSKKTWPSCVLSSTTEMGLGWIAQPHVAQMDSANQRADRGGPQVSATGTSRPLRSSLQNAMASSNEDADAYAATTSLPAATASYRKRMSEKNYWTPTRFIAYGVGHVLNDMCASTWFSYLLVFLRQVRLRSCLSVCMHALMRALMCWLLGCFALAS